MCGRALQKDGVPQEETIYTVVFILLFSAYFKTKGDWNSGSFWTQHEYGACNCHVAFSLRVSLLYYSSRPFETAAANAEEAALFQSDYFSIEHRI